MGYQFRLKVEIFSATMKATHLGQNASFWELLDNKGKLDLNDILIMCFRYYILYTCIYHIHKYVYKLYTKSIERENRRYDYT